LIGLLAAYEDVVTRGDRQEAARLEKQFDDAFGDLKIEGLAIGGQVAQVINTAKSYRTQVVETVGAEAQSFRQLMPQYRQNPRLVLSKLWEDARETILTGDVETFYTVPGQLELELNRDPELQKERQQEQLRANKREQKAQRRR
jgi:hypothetical protein